MAKKNHMNSQITATHLIMQLPKRVDNSKPQMTHLLIMKTVFTLELLNFLLKNKGKQKLIHLVTKTGGERWGNPAKLVAYLKC